MATQQEVLELHRSNPDMSAVAIANRLDCGSGYVRATAKRLKLSLPHHKPDSLIALGRAARDAGLTVEKIKSMRGRP